jgi:hypothetical protein
MPNTILVGAQKSQEVVNSHEKLIIIKEIFLDIGKQMLKTSYTLNMGQLLQIALKLKIYLWQKLKQKNTHNLIRATIEKQVGSLVPKVGIATIVIDNHMAIIQVQIKKNTIEDVLLDGGYIINIIIE